MLASYVFIMYHVFRCYGSGLKCTTLAIFSVCSITNIEELDRSGSIRFSPLQLQSVRHFLDGLRQFISKNGMKVRW